MYRTVNCKTDELYFNIQPFLIFGADSANLEFGDCNMCWGVKLTGLVCTNKH